MKRADYLIRQSKWSEAAKAQKERLGKIPTNDTLGRADALERIGRYLYRAAMQADNSREFQATIKESLLAHRKAQKYLQNLGPDENARRFRNQAMEAFLQYWIAANHAEKMRLLGKTWHFAKKAMRSFETTRMGKGFAETYLDLSLAPAIGFFYDKNLKDRIQKIAEAARYGRKSIAFIRSMRDRAALTRVLARTALFLDSLSDRYPNPAIAREYQKEALGVWEEALRISRNVAVKETSRPPDGFYRILDQDQNFDIAKKALDLVRAERDNFAIGWLSVRLAHYTFWRADASEDLVVARRLLTEALHYEEEAAKRFKIISFTSPIGGVLWAHFPYAEYFLQSNAYEQNSERARRFLEKSVQSTTELLRLTGQSGYPDIMQYGFHVGGKAASFLAAVETDKLRKKKLLTEALGHKSRALDILNRIEPKINWSTGVAFAGLAYVQDQLSELEADLRKKRELLLDAVANKEKALSTNTKFLGLLERPEKHVLRGPLGNGYRQLGDYLLKLYRLTRDERFLRRAAESYQTSAEWFQSISRFDSLAQSQWKVGEAYDLLQQYSLASEAFRKASKTYLNLGQKVQALKEFSKDYSLYMSAWGEIENARLNHSKFDFSQASKAYERAARFHRMSGRWRFLSSYYIAWTRLETGEHLSRIGRHGSAIKAFEDAATIFSKSRASLKDGLSLTDQPDEKSMVEGLLKTQKEAYSKARIIIEEALAAETMEDYRASSGKFAQASNTLKEMSTRSTSELDREETGFLSELCRAWHLSARAELEGSTKALEEASRIFMSAGKNSTNKSASRLAVAHEAFSRALIASYTLSSKFDPADQKQASEQFELAATNYRETGFSAASNDAIARKLLLQASTYINKANSESDPSRQAESYKIADTLFEEAARAFKRAGNPKKREQALRLLKSARMESEIALKLTDVINAASEQHTNVAFQPPTRGDERAVGLDRFQESDIDARLTKTTTKDGQLNLEIDILNIGDRPVNLVRVETVQDDSELQALVSGGDGGTSFEKRRIAPTSVEKLKLAFRIQTEGLAEIRPRIVFADEKKIERERMMEPIFASTSRIVDFLGEAFVKDYSEKKLAEANSGWRTLMEVVKALRIPRSNVYGEPRYGRMFGKQLEALVRTSLVEYRIFPGERGRGGDITKLRVQLNNASVAAYLERVAPELVIASTLGPRILGQDNGKNELHIMAAP